MQIFRGTCAKVHSNTDKLKETFLEATSKCRISLLTLTFSFIFNSKARISHWEIHGTKTQHFFQFKLKPLDFCNNKKIGPPPVFGKPVYYLGSLPSWLPVLLSASDTTPVGFSEQLVSVGSGLAPDHVRVWIKKAAGSWKQGVILTGSPTAMNVISRSKWVGEPD